LRGGERFVSARGECARKAIGAPSMIRWIRRGCGLGEDVADLRFELSVKSSAAEAE
jgi:hypothetical protein